MKSAGGRQHTSRTRWRSGSSMNGLKMLNITNFTTCCGLRESTVSLIGKLWVELSGTHGIRWRVHRLICCWGNEILSCPVELRPESGVSPALWLSSLRRKRSRSSLAPQRKSTCHSPGSEQIAYMKQICCRGTDIYWERLGQRKLHWVIVMEGCQKTIAATTKEGLLCYSVRESRTV